MEVPKLPPGDSEFEQLVKALGRNDPALVEYASAQLVSLGDPIVEELSCQLHVPRRHADHINRILDVIRRIHKPPGGELISIILRLRRGPEKVRQKAAEVLASLSPRVKSDFERRELTIYNLLEHPPFRPAELRRVEKAYGGIDDNAIRGLLFRMAFVHHRRQQYRCQSPRNP